MSEAGKRKVVIVINLLEEMTSLELFCGTKSFTKEANRAGIKKNTTLDINPVFKPSLKMDIRDYEACDARHGHDIIWASPPCQCFSRMAAGHYWKKIEGRHVPKDSKAVNAMSLIRRTLKIIDSEQPVYWFIENPMGILRFLFDDLCKKTGFNYRYKRETVTYCQYGTSHMNICFSPVFVFL